VNVFIFHDGKESFSMTNHNLKDVLERLRRELETIEVRDETQRERLRQLEADMRALEERTEETAQADEPILERIQESIDEFQEDHPQLTLMLSQMMTILSNAGI
jgi:predicted  nucleic acid-binding Zn-ribbon protein